MKRLLIIFTILLTTVVGLRAQTGLNINLIFGGKYVSDPSVSETVISGEQNFLKRHNLTTLATFKGDAATYAPVIQPLVLADGAKARGRNVRYRQGELRYAFFELAGTGKGNNRYIYYINNPDASKPTVMVIFLEGSLSASKATDLIKSFAK